MEIKNNNKIKNSTIDKGSRLNDVIKNISVKDILDVFIFPFIFLISKIHAKKLHKQNIWLIQENPNEACDNGYILFKYLREHRKDINCYYVIKKKSKDFEKVNKFVNVIIHRSLKHWIYYLNASKIIVTQKYANPSPAIMYVLHTKNIIKTPRIFLQHGITKDVSDWLLYNRTNFRLFICGAKREYEFVKETFGYPEEYVKYTGLARFDNLNPNVQKGKNKIILIAPTWRKWITNANCEYFKRYNSLVNNKELTNFLEKNNYTAYFVLHKNMKKFKNLIVSKSKNIIVKNNEDVDIQGLLNKTDLLITDFSSIFMDIAYRKRPIIYYQFDEEEFRNKHLKEGYFSYYDDGFGDVLKSEKEVVNKIEYYIKNNFEIESKYETRMDKFFERKDGKNCKRIVEVIENI